MKNKNKIFLLMIVAVMAVFNANAQVQIESPHPDLSVKVSRCTYAGGALVIDLLITNYGPEETIHFYGSSWNAPNTMAVDDEGNQYKKGSGKIWIGTAGDLTFTQTSILFMQDIPTKLRVKIDQVDRNATSLAILRIAGYSSKFGMSTGSGSSNPIIIKNIEFSKN